jgi:hypothetical protein
MAKNIVAEIMAEKVSYGGFAATRREVYEDIQTRLPGAPRYGIGSADWWAFSPPAIGAGRSACSKPYITATTRLAATPAIYTPARCRTTYGTGTLGGDGQQAIKCPTRIGLGAPATPTPHSTRHRWPRSGRSSSGGVVTPISPTAMALAREPSHLSLGTGRGSTSPGRMETEMTDRAVQPEAPTTEADALLRGWVEHHQPEGYEGIQDCSDINDRTEAYLARAASQERPQPERRTSDYHPDELIAFDPRPTGHPRTYSLVGTPHRFLVTDDESGRNIGYADEIGGPLVSGVAQERPSIDVDRLATADALLRDLSEMVSDWDDSMSLLDELPEEWVGQLTAYLGKFGPLHPGRYAEARLGSVASPEPSE